MIAKELRLIYNSRNLIGLKNPVLRINVPIIYNSRNLIGLKNLSLIRYHYQSTIVEI